MERLGSLAREREVHLGQPGLKFVFSRGQAWLKFCPLRRPGSGTFSRQPHSAGGAWHASSWLLDVSCGARVLPSAVSATSALAAFKDRAFCCFTELINRKLKALNRASSTFLPETSTGSCKEASVSWPRTLALAASLTRGDQQEGKGCCRNRRCFGGW